MSTLSNDLIVKVYYFSIIFTRPIAPHHAWLDFSQMVKILLALNLKFLVVFKTSNLSTKLLHTMVSFLPANESRFSVKDACQE